jgi:hypothetical protein
VKRRKKPHQPKKPLQRKSHRPQKKLLRSRRHRLKPTRLPIPISQQNQKLRLPRN